MSSKSTSRRIFVECHGFEKRFFCQNVRKYFGADADFFFGVDMSTGREGLDICSPIQRKLKEILVARMREDSKKACTQFLNDRHLQWQRITVDHSPHIAAAMSPHIELFPPLDSLYSTLSHQRRSHSTPSTPISTQTPFFPPPFFPPSSAAPPSELRLSRAPSIDYRGGTPMLRTVSDFGPGNFFAGSPSEEELCRLPETAGLQASLFKSVVGRVR